MVSGVIASVHAGRRADDSVLHTMQVKMALGAYLGELLDAETGQRGYLITGDTTYLEPYRRAQVGARERDLRALIRDNPRQSALLDEAARLANERLDELQVILEIHAHDPAAAIARLSEDRGNVLMNDFRAAIATMQGEEDRLFEVRHADVRRSFTRTLVVLVAASVVLGLTLLHLVQTGRDLDRARADAEIAVDRARAVEFNDRFLAVLGHDLKNPLTAIRISVERLEKKLGDDGQPHLARIHRSLDRMGRMIDQLLDLSRIRLGSGITLERRPIDAADVVRSAVDELRAAHPRRSVELVVSGDTTGSFDPERLSQIAMNLIGNAMVHGTAATTVKTTLEGRDTELVLRVENAGTMTAADRFVLFDPFRRGLHEPSKTARSAGLGLGLSIVCHLVDQHQGRIVIESGPSTVFTVFLPR